MHTYIIRRLLLMVPTLFLVVTLVFIMIRLIPGDAVALLLADQNFTEGTADELREQLGLADPIVVQYGNYLADVVTLDFGASLWTDKGVLHELVVKRLPVTLELAGWALFFALTLALPIGILSAIRQNSWMDYLGRSVAIGGLAIPGFFLATLAIIIPSRFLPELYASIGPPVTFEGPFSSVETNLRWFILPGFLMGLVLGASLMRMLRSTMLETLSEDYVRTAWAKGLRERSVIMTHVLRNAFIPVITIMGLQIAFIIGGTVVYETIFGLPGVGTYLFSAAVRRDYPVLQAVNILLAAMILLLNLGVDLSYSFLDPRIRYR